MTSSRIKYILAGALALASTAPVLSAYASPTGIHSPSAARLSGSSVVSSALSYVGSPYAYSGDTPSTGFSCTGFVHWVYSQFGYSTPEDVGSLYYSYPHVATGDLQPGDVLVFANTFHAGLSHAAIYIGNGQMVGADNFAQGVHEDNMNDGYWGPRFVGAVRIADYTAPAQQVAGYHAANTSASLPYRAMSYTRPAYTPISYNRPTSYTTSYTPRYYGNMATRSTYSPSGQWYWSRR